MSVVDVLPRLEPARDCDWDWITDGLADAARNTLAPWYEGALSDAEFRERCAGVVAMARSPGWLKNEVLVLRDGDRPVAHVWMGVPSGPGLPTAHLLNLYVESNFRGTGLGTQLMQAADDWARVRLLARIGLNVGARNPARRLYLRSGYITDTMRLIKKTRPHGLGRSDGLLTHEDLNGDDWQTVVDAQTDWRWQRSGPRSWPQLDRAALRAETATNAESLRKALVAVGRADADRGVIAIRAATGRLAALAIVEAQPEFFTGRRECVLTCLHASAGEDGQSLRTGLLHAAEAWADEHGLGALAISIGAHSAELRELLAGQGYIEDSWQMSKSLP